MNPDARPRVNAAAVVPETGSTRASANVIVTWDHGTPLADVEDAIKAASREAIQRARDSRRPTGPPPGPPNPPRPPHDRPFA